MWSKGDKVIEVHFIVRAGMGCVYLEPFRKWSRDKSLLQLKWGRYIAQSKPIKPTQTILEKAQQRSIIVNGAR